jgi:hypothetical protein
MDTVLRLFVLLQYMDTQRNLVLTSGSSVEGIFATAEIPVIREVHAVLSAFAILDQGADLAVSPKGYSYGVSTISQAFNGCLVPLRGRCPEGR